MKANAGVDLRLLGIGLFAKALTHILGGLVGICGMDKTDIPAFMKNAVNHTSGVYSGVLLQFASCMAIIAVAVLLCRLTTPSNKTAAAIALCLYVFEAILLAVSQILSFSLLRVSQAFMESNHTPQMDSAVMLLDGMDFTMNLANIPFGIGTMLFYCLLFQNKAIPRWLSLWALISIVPVWIGTLIQVYGITLPFGIMVLHAPFEFIAGIYLCAKNPRNTNEWHAPPH